MLAPTRQGATRPRLLFATCALIVASFVAAFAIDLGIERQAKLQEGERSVEYFGRILAEQTARSLASIEVLLGEVAQELRPGHDWRAWNPRDGHRYLLQRHTRSLPQLRELTLVDAQGKERFGSTALPARGGDARGDAYFRALAAGQERAGFGPYVAANSGRYSYGLARRLGDPGGEFAGVIVAAYETADFQAACASVRGSESPDAALINAAGIVVSPCRPGSLGKDSPVAGRPLSEVLGDGALAGMPLGDGIVEHDGQLVAVTPIAGQPELRVITVLSTRELLAPWRQRLAEVLLLITLAGASVVFGGLIVNRQLAELRRLTGELQDSHDQLEDRVQAATRELSRKKEEAERNALAKSRFLAAASHDLRQPLHALALFSADLRQTAVQPEVRHAGQNIEAAVRVLSGLFETLLDISRIDLAGIKPTLRPVALQEVVERVAATFVRPAADKYLYLCSRPTRAWGFSDPVLLERLLGNLVANAIQYTEDGGILIAVRRRGQRLRIEVRDSGIGIAEDQQPLIFDEFYQIANPERAPVKGLGLGLSIAARLAAALNTRITLHSRPGRGSVFAVEVPIASPVAATKITPPVTTDASVATSGAAILIVGGLDEASPCLPELLERWGYTTRFAAEATAVGVMLADPAFRPLVVISRRTAIAQELARLDENLSIIVLGDDSPGAAGCHVLGLPLKPAKLRALLRKLEDDAAQVRPPAQMPLRA